MTPRNRNFWDGEGKTGITLYQEIHDVFLACLHNSLIINENFDIKLSTGG
jgi:hypothetical protein